MKGEKLYRLNFNIEDDHNNFIMNQIDSKLLHMIYD
jgi:hypothetical protein